LKYRKKLGYKASDIVVVYSGSLAKWQNFDFILKSFNDSENDNLNLLILTKDIESATKKTSTSEKKDSIKLYSVDYHEVPNFLNASDYGLLIRDINETNLNASPTKFGEYINSGLTVIINKIDSDYYKQAIKLNLNVIILQNKHELSNVLNSLNPVNTGINPISINNAKEIVKDQLHLIYKTILKKNTRICISHKVLIIGPYGSELKGGISTVLNSYNENFPGIRIIGTIKKNTIIGNILPFFISIGKMVFILLSKPQIKIIHIHGASRGSFFRKYIIFLLAKYTFNKKIIYHIHGGEFHIFYKQSLFHTKHGIKHLINNSNAIIVLSKSWYTFFRDTFNPRNIFIVNNMIKEPNDIPERKLISKHVQFLFIGRLDKRKGIYELLEATHRLKSKRPGLFKVIICGDGKEMKGITHRINELNLNDYMILKGWVTGELKDKILSESDIFVLPTYNEALPLSIIEAFSYKIPAIASKVGGIPEIVTSHENGILIKPRDITDLLSAMEYFILNPTKIAEYGLSSFNVINKYLPKTVKPQLIDIYKNVLASNS